MARTGRPPKAIEQHIRDGTLSSEHPAKTPLVVGGRKKPECPKHLPRAAKKFFLAVVEDMWEAGVLDHADTPLVITAAEFWGSAMQAAKDIKKHGQVIEVTRGARDGAVGYIVREKNPSVQILHEALMQFRQCCDLLGIGPSARARLAGLGVKSKALEKEVPGIAALRAIKGGIKT